MILFDFWSWLWNFLAGARDIQGARKIRETTLVDVMGAAVWLLVMTLSVTSSAAPPCPMRCSCNLDSSGNIEGLTCENLDTFPQHIPRTARRVTIRASTLSIVPSQAFSNMERLENVEFNNLQIARIAACAFSDLNSTVTKSIVLRDSQIGAIEKGAFSNIANVDTFQIYRCSVNTIQSGAFLGLYNVRNLKIFHSQITEIASQAFWHVTGVKNVVELYSVEIADMGSTAFYNFTDINRFELWDSTIDNLPPYFLYIWNSHTVSLHGLDIKVIHEKAFGGMFNLNTVEFYGSKIMGVRSNAFSGMANVENLIMKELVFQGELPARILHSDVTKSFQFYNNQMMGLPCRLEIRAELLQVLDQVFGNQVASCDCRMQWLVDDWNADVNLVGNPILTSFRCEGGNVGGKGLISQDVLDYLWLLQCPLARECGVGPLPQVASLPDLSSVQCAPGGNTGVPTVPEVPEDPVETTTAMTPEVTYAETEGPSPVPGQELDNNLRLIMVSTGAAGGAGILIILISIICCICRRKKDGDEDEEKHKGPRPLPTPEPQRLMPLALRNLDNKHLDRSSAATTVYEDINEEEVENSEQGDDDDDYEKEKESNVKENSYEGLDKADVDNKKKKGYQGLEKEDSDSKTKTSGKGYQGLDKDTVEDDKKKGYQELHEEDNSRENIGNDYQNPGEEFGDKHRSNDENRLSHEYLNMERNHLGEVRIVSDNRDSEGSYMEPDYDGYMIPSPTQKQNPHLMSGYDNIHSLVVKNNEYVNVTKD